MAQYENIEVDQGTSVKYQIQLLDIGGGRRDLSGCLVRGSLKHTYASDSADAVFFLTNIDAPPTKGIINFSLNPTQTTALTKRRYVYDVEIEYSVDSVNVIERVLEGQVFLSQQVTAISGY
tara:strand:- start:1233 stop:1595 length:363 start_codon:yes stop_codon:yes gene_type:complete